MEREEQRKGGKERGKIGRRWRGKNSGREEKKERKDREEVEREEQRKGGKKEER